MEINTQYIQHLNDIIMLGKKNNKKTLDTSTLEVLQIGVGGFTSCGKTLLIDAIFSLFSANSKPHYLPENFGKITPLTTTLGYDNHTVLQNFVRQKINQAETQTPLEDGMWNKNMYEGTLTFTKETKTISTKTIIIRNLPGELFRLYYTEDEGIANKSLNEQFKEFMKSYPNKDIINNLFKQGQRKQGDIEKIRDDFFHTYLLSLVATIDKLKDEEIKTAVKPLVKIRNKQEHYDNFFAYLFFYTSDYNIYCIDATKEYASDDKASIADKNFFSTDGEEKRENIIFCVTKFDKIINREIFFNTTQATKKDIKWYWSLMEKMYVEIKPKEETVETQNKERCYDKLLKKIKDKCKRTKEHTTSKTETQNEKLSIIKTEDWTKVVERIGGQENINNKAINLFFTSTAYHNDCKRFFDYENTATEKWTNSNILVRRSLGVLELMLHILKKNGVCHNLPCDDDDFRIIRNKIV